MMVVGEQELVYECGEIVRAILQSEIYRAITTDPIEWWQVKQYHDANTAVILHCDKAAATLPKWIEIA